MKITIIIIAELSRARSSRQRSTMGEKKILPIPENLVITWPYTERPPSVRITGIPMFTVTLSSYFWSPGENWLHINVVINLQLSKQVIRWPVSPDRIAGSGVEPSKSSTFLKLSTDKVVLVFKCSQAQVSFFKNSYEICCVYVTMAPHYLHFDFKLTSDAKISHIFNSAIYLISVIVKK